jgi:hypothetical protein
MIGVKCFDWRRAYLEDKKGSGNVLEGGYVCDVKDKFKISNLVFTHKRETAV